MVKQNKQLSTSRNLVRIHPLARIEIEKLQQQEYNGLIPFTQASHEYVRKKQLLEEQNTKLRKQLDDLLKDTNRRKPLL